MKRILAVSEYFYSLQGEGQTMGVPAIFLRLSGCNLMCGGHGTEKDRLLHDGATWRCDTIEVWLKGKSRTFEDLTNELIDKVDFINRLKNGVHLVITGGEPLLQMNRIIAYLEYLETEFDCKPITEIETNATVLPVEDLNARVTYWNTSPKLSNSGMELDVRLFPETLAFFNQQQGTIFKFVILNPSDWEEIRTSFLETQFIDKRKIVLMPGAESIEQLLENNKLVAEICIREQVRMCTRLHVEVWNQLTGV